jgi:hypothetical protein
MANSDWADYGEIAQKKYKYFADCGKRLLITGSVSALVSILLLICLPRKQTVIEMLIANAATTDNIGVGVDAIKSAADYVIETIQKLK